MTHSLDPRHVKALLRANVIKGKCDTCLRTVDDGCSIVDCPHRRARVYAPQQDGTVPPRRPPGTYDWSNDE